MKTIQAGHLGRLATLFLLAGLAGLFAACSSDDSSEPPKAPPGPQVVLVEPEALSSRVNVQQNVKVTFDQDLDQTQDIAPFINLGSADVTNVTYLAANSIEVEHTEWQPGEEVKVTLSAPIRGANGSTMDAPYTWSFWTETNIVSLLSSAPAHEATDVDLNTKIFLLFSEEMNVASVNSEVFVQNILPDPIGPQELSFTADRGEDEWMVLTMAEALPSESTIRVTVPTTTESETSGRFIAEQKSVSFTTGTTGDTTPPELVSMEPANGSTISANTPWIRFTFDEPIDPDSLQPSMLGAQFWLLLEFAPTEPQWSENFTILTIPLPTPMPEGLPLRAMINPFKDFAGNSSSEGLDISLDVEGVADYYPFVDGLKFTFETKRYWDEGMGEMGPEFRTAYEGLRREDADTWNRVEYASDFVTDDGWDILGRTEDAVQLMGFVERDEGTTVTTLLTPVVDWLKLPLSAQQWSGSTTAANTGSSITVEYEAELVRMEDLPLYPEGLEGPQLRGWLDNSKRADEPEILWLDCWMWTLDFAMMDGETTVQTGADTLWYAPAVGVVWTRNRELQPNGDYEWTQGYLSGFEFPGASSNID